MAGSGSGRTASGWTASGWTAQFSLGALLEETGVQCRKSCQTITEKISELLNVISSGKDLWDVDKVRTNLQTLSRYLDSLQLLLPQLLHEQDGFLDVTNALVGNVIDPYLELIAAFMEENELISSCNITVWSITSLILQNKISLKVCGPGILCIFTKNLEKLCKDDASLYENSPVNTTAIISVIAHAIHIADPKEMERNGLSLSMLFDEVLHALKERDLKICCMICSTILPLLVSGDMESRAAQVWNFVKDVHSQAICVTSHGLDLMLAIFCCLSDVFLYQNKSSPFSTLYQTAIEGNVEKPTLDLRKEDQFWEIVQDGLVSSDPLARKQAMYLVRCVLESVQGMKAGVEVKASNKHIFWWSEDYEVALKKAWDDLVLVLDTMEEKQIHIVKPVRAHLKSVLAATADKCSNGCYVLHLSWQFVALSRVFQHTEAKSVIKWGVQECLQMNFEQSPLLLRENWKFIFEQLLKVLNVSMLYGKGQTEEISLMITSFFQRFMASLNEEDKCDFLKCLFAAMDSQKLADVPLVFLTYSLSQLSEEALIGPDALGFIRSILLNGILTHKPYLRAAAQHFLLIVVSKLSNINMLSYSDVIRTLGSFRESECLIMGTEAWTTAYSFFARFCHAKMEENPSQSIIDYFKVYIHKTIASNKKSTEECDKPGHVHVTRALILLVEGENRKEQHSPRVLSSDVMSLSEVVAIFLDPVLETAAMAGQRPYLSSDVVKTSLEIITVPAKLVLNRRKGTMEEDNLTSLLLDVMEKHLSNILSYTVDQLFLGCKEDGKPSLSQVLFHLDVLETLYQFSRHSGYRFLLSDSCIPQKISTRAATILHSLLVNESVGLSATFLGAVTALKWSLNHMTTSSQPALPTAIPCSTQVTMPLDINSGPSLQNTNDQARSLLHSTLDLIKSFPMSLNLKKEPNQPKHQTDADSLQDHTHLIAQEEWDWGPLMSHCTSAYWECLLAYLKWSSSLEHRCPDSSDNGSSSDERPTIGCRDVIILMESCTSNLDTAASSVAVVIEALAALVPKLLLANGGCGHLVSATPLMWSHVMELKSYQAPFWKALHSYVGVVFHSTLLLNHSTDPDIKSVQQSSIQDFVELGEAKLGTFNILADHVLRIWEEALISQKVNDSGQPGVETLFQSLQAHCELLLKMATFGPIHKKNLRNVEEVELFLDKLDEDIYSSLNLTRHTELNASVRVKLVLFLLWLAEMSSEEVTLASQFHNFMSAFIRQLLVQLKEATDSCKHYYLNSTTHRVKLRLSQVLLVMVDHLTESMCHTVANSLLRLLQSDNQLSVRYLLEWVVVTVMVKYPATIEKLYQLLEEESDLRFSRMCSVFTIAKHVGNGLPEEFKSSYYMRVLPSLLRWSFCSHFVARLYAQTGLVDMWEDCLQLSCLSSVQQSLDYLKSNVKFLRENGDCQKFRTKINNNVLFSLVKAESDRNFETIFHILPLLCDVFLEEVIAPGCFEVVMATRYPDLGISCGWSGMALRCSNSLLCGALEKHLSTPVVRDGTDTRSIAYRLMSETSSNEAQPAATASVTSDLDIQKKISLLCNPSAILSELFPHSDDLTSLLASLSEKGVGESGSVQQGMKSGLVVVASLLSKIPNLGGICRTGEIYGIESLILSDKKILEEKEFQSLSVTAEKWMNIQEVKLNKLQEYLASQREAGYSIVGLEQTMKSKSLSAYTFKHKTVVVLGNEREGIPPSIIYMLDHCIEIPQHGTIRSLNVHVSAALVIWEYSKQFFHGPITE